ncbi:RNA-directed DNA polymerase [Paracoccus sp. J39]|uniref:RNA-directed DNA polymerase n=1 Tax=Paracoccus sp. J39 TaxID=935848 RepID=UPI0018DBCE22|nr:RNA-directed DNA polymerase [Paracoccus sp. J39]
MEELRIRTPFTRKVWRHLADGEIPICSESDIRDAWRWVEDINRKIKTRSYVPEVVHGYMGIEKNSGVTRFIPIISKEDMAVYYHLCGAIGDAVIRDKDRMFGGWRAIPTGQNLRTLARIRPDEAEALLFEQNYYAMPFSSAAWFQQYKNFNELLQSLVNNSGTGNYVITTDIANFYDSIDIGRLVRKLRIDAPKLSEHVSLLEIFLGYWNRRTTGYQQSSKGIPQEIISDGSRNLSHYYLQDFDDKFDDYCKKKDLIYVRWADDILIFGSSVKALEVAVHNASRMLLYDGLNLNASKTKCYSRRDFESYRGLRLLSAISRSDGNAYRRELRAALNWARHNPFKLDTVFRASIGFISKMGCGATTFEKNFLQETAKENPKLIGSLNPSQLNRLISLADDPIRTFRDFVSYAASYEITAPKARILSCIRGQSHNLRKSGISVKTLETAINRLDSSSDESGIIQAFCTPATRLSISKAFRRNNP